MAPHRWANDEQFTFLKSHLDSFIQSQKEKKIYAFWDRVIPLWFTKWPEPKPNTGDNTADDKAHGSAIQKRKNVSIFRHCFS